MLYESNVASLAEKELAPVSLLGVDDPKRHAIRASMHALTWCLLVDLIYSPSPSESFVRAFLILSFVSCIVVVFFICFLLLLLCSQGTTATAQEVGHAVLEQDCHDLGFLDF